MAAVVHFSNKNRYYIANWNGKALTEWEEYNEKTEKKENKSNSNNNNEEKDDVKVKSGREKIVENMDR